MNNNKCIHCGDDCGKHPIMWEEKSFCCNGYKTVFQILDKSHLYTYYNLENTAGIKIDKL
ncbi:heavy metal translocating P-type ATPase metal-binding domain-containing protein [candidate division KSB1 bacterium]